MAKIYYFLPAANFDILLNRAVHDLKVQIVNCGLIDKNQGIRNARNFLSLQNFGRVKASNVSFKAVQGRPDALLAKSLYTCQCLYLCFLPTFSFNSKILCECFPFPYFNLIFTFSNNLEEIFVLFISSVNSTKTFIAKTSTGKVWA